MQKILPCLLGVRISETVIGPPAPSKVLWKRNGEVDGIMAFYLEPHITCTIVNPVSD